MGIPKMEGNFLITGAAQGFGKEFTRRVLKSNYLGHFSLQPSTLQLSMPTKHDSTMLDQKIEANNLQAEVVSCSLTRTRWEERRPTKPSKRLVVTITNMMM